MRMLLGIPIGLFLVAAAAVAQMDQPMTLNCSNRLVVKSEVRSVEEGTPSTLVTTPVNQAGEHIPGLTAKDFTIAKGKKKADILKVEEIKAVESTVMRVVFVIDNSQSMSPYLDALLGTLERTIRGFSRAVRVAVLFFNEQVGKDSEFRYNTRPLPVVHLRLTPDKDRAVTYMKKMLVEPSLSRSTYLYDEVYAAFDEIKADTGKVDRSFAIVFSDGEDNASMVEPETDLGADKLGTTFFTIDYRTKSNAFLEKLASGSGGEHFIAKDSDELAKVFDRIASKIVAKGYRITYQFKAPPTASISTPTKELVMEEDVIRETFPLLNYVFFDQGSSMLPDRYVRIPAEKVAKFDESSIEGGALDFYYSILNVIGSRLKKYPAATLTLTGCTNEFAEEKRDRRLAQDRAETVKQYLTTLWGIPEAQIKIVAGRLPAVPSSSRDEDGRAENSRVEIACDNWNVMKPVTFVRRIAGLNPPTVGFAASYDAPEGLQSYTLSFEQNGKPFDLRSGGILEKSITWNWKNRKGDAPASSGNITYTLAVVDQAGDSFVTPKGEIAVREVKRERLQNVQLEGGITKEKISLILFEFDKADPGPRNVDIMNEFVYPRISDPKSVVISGYTDIIGKEDYNQKLSERRAKAVDDILLQHEAGILAPEKVQYVGYGETNPIFPNTTPEGRFYNRTVSILIER